MMLPFPPENAHLDPVPACALQLSNCSALASKFNQVFARARVGRISLTVRSFAGRVVVNKVGRVPIA